MHPTDADTSHATTRDLRVFYFALIALIGLAMVWANNPGLLAFDALVQWYQGRFNVFVSGDPLRAHPPVMSFVWRGLDQLYPGPLPMLILQTSLLALALYCLLSWLRPPPILALAVVAALVLSPFVIANSGKIVKDVLGGHSILLAFLLLPLSRNCRHALLCHLIAGGLLAFAILVRYQFIAVLPFVIAGAVWHGNTVAPSGWRRACMVLVGFATGVAVLSLGMRIFLNLGPSDLEGSLRKVALYDIAGIVTRVPDANLSALSDAGIDPSEFRRRVTRDYSHNYVDTLWGAEDQSAFYQVAPVPTSTLVDLWIDLSLQHRMAFLTHHLMTYTRVLGMGDITICNIFYKNRFAIPVGLDGLLVEGRDGLVDPTSLPQPPIVFLFTWRYFPADFLGFRSYVYILVGLAVAAGLLLTPAANPLARLRSALLPLLGAGIAYHLTFLLLPQACEIRYSYFTTVAVQVCLCALMITWWQHVRAARIGPKLRA